MFECSKIKFCVNFITDIIFFKSKIFPIRVGVVTVLSTRCPQKKKIRQTFLDCLYSKVPKVEVWNKKRIENLLTLSL